MDPNKTWIDKELNAATTRENTEIPENNTRSMAFVGDPSHRGDKTTIESVDSEKTVVDRDSKGIAASTSPIASPKMQDWQMVERFPAKGGEADIFLVRKKGKEMIYKLYRWGIQPKIEVLDRIIRLSCKFPEFFVQVHERGFDPESKRFYELEEFFPNGSLKDFLSQGKLGVDDTKRLCEQISSALLKLHESGILHLDLKPDNILVRNKQPLDVVLTDFGIASILDEEFSKKMTDIKGTSLYQSPESLSGIVGPKSDWWGLGILIHELLEGRHPFEGLQRQMIYFRLTTAGIPIPKSLPATWRQLLKGLLTRNPEFRWGGEEVKKWLDGAEVKTFFDDEMAQASLQLAVDTSSLHFKRLEKPFSFLGESFFVLEELFRAMASSTGLWNQGKLELSRGNISRCLQDNKDERSEKLKRLIESESETDHMLFTAIYTFFPDLPLVWWGKIVDKRFVLELMAKACDTGVFGEEEKLLENVFSGKLFQDFSNLTGKKTEDLAEILQLAKVADATELRRIDLVDRSRILLFALQKSFSPDKALDSLQTAISGDHEFEMILQAVETRGFPDFAYRTSIWKRGDEAAWKLSAELFGRSSEIVRPALDIIGRMSYIIAQSIGQDRSLRDLLFALSVRKPMDKDIFERWNNLREKHIWLNDVARISFEIPQKVDCAAFLDDQIHRKMFQDRWNQLFEYILPPFFLKFRNGEMIPSRQLQVIKDVFPKPRVLIPMEKDLKEWGNLSEWLEELPKNGLRVDSYSDLIEIKKEYAKTTGLRHQRKIGVMGITLCLGMYYNDLVNYNPPVRFDFLMLFSLVLFSVSVLWPILRKHEKLKNYKGKPPFEPVFSDPVLIRQKSPKPFNYYNRMAFASLILRLSLFHPDFMRFIDEVGPILAKKFGLGL